MRRTITAAATAALALGLIAGPAAAKGGPPAVDGTIVDVAASVNAETGEFSTLLFLVDYFGLGETLATTEGITVFAPTDDAFAALFDVLDTTPGELLSTPDGEAAVLNILGYHVDPDEVSSRSDIARGSTLSMLNDGELTTKGDTVGNAQLVDPTIGVNASNGKLYVIDAVLLP